MVTSNFFFSQNMMTFEFFFIKTHCSIFFSFLFGPTVGKFAKNKNAAVQDIKKKVEKY
jgi:hypothetical protein